MKTPFKTYILLLDLAGLELGASYYRHRARLGVGQRKGSKLAPGVIVTDGVVMTPSQSLAKEVYILTIAATVEAVKAFEEGGGVLKRQPTIQLGQARFRPVEEGDSVGWSTSDQLTLRDTQRHEQLVPVLTSAGRPPKASDWFVECMDCGKDEIVNAGRVFQCQNCGAVDVRVSRAEAVMA